MRGAARVPRWQPRRGSRDAAAPVEETRDLATYARRGGRWHGAGRRSQGGRFGGGERRRPNFFVGFRILDHTVIDAIERLQRRIVDTLPETQACMIDPRTLHVTLCVMNLPDDAAVAHATRILHEQVAQVARLAFGHDAPAYDFRGLDFFGNNNVLYTPLDVSKPAATSLATLAESLHTAFDAAGFATETFRKPFTPHLTIWKTSKDREYINRLNRQRRLDDPIQDALADYLRESAFDAFTALMGTETPTSVELLSMREKEVDGYYKALASVSLVITEPKDAKTG